MTKTPTALNKYAMLFLTCIVLVAANSARAQDTQEQKEVQEKDEILAAEKKANTEEIIVTAGDGDGRRRGRLGETASRDMLEESYEDDIEGFLDELGAISTLDGDDEGNLFSFQGMAPEMNQLTLGGQKQGRSGPGLGDIPTDMVESITVITSPMASMEEGASGGTVNIELRSPANIKNQLMGMRSNLSRSSGTGRFDPSLSSYIGNSFQDKKIGFLVNIAYKNNHTKTDALNTKSWELRPVDGYDGEYRVPNTIISSLSMDSSEKLSSLAILGFRPTYALDISLKANISLLMKPSSYTSLQGMLSKQRQLDGIAVDGDIITELSSHDNRRSNLRLQMTDRAMKSFSQSYSMDIKWQNKGTRLSFSSGYSHTNQHYPEPSSTINFSKKADFGYGLSSEEFLPILSLAAEDILVDDFKSRNIVFTDSRMITSNRYVEADLDRRIQTNYLRRLKVGVKYRKNTYDRAQDKGRHVFADPLYLDSIEGEFLADDFLGSISDDSIIHSWPYGNITQLIEADTIAPDNMDPNLSGTFDVAQNTYAAYMQGDFRFSLAGDMPVSGNLGVRYVGTDILSHGYQVISTVAEAIERSSQYSDILPSLSFNVRVLRRLILQLGVSRVLTRPNLAMLSASLRLNENDETGSSGNSQLQPFRANQAMVKLTWIRSRQSRYVLSAAYKDVDSFYFRDYSLTEIDETAYLIANPVNGADASIMALNLEATHSLGELSKQLADFSFKTNLSYNYSQTDFMNPMSMERLMMPQITPLSAKFTLSYRKDKLSARVRYQWQSKTLRTPSSLSGLPEWQKSYGDMSIGTNYKIRDGILLSFDIRNLMNANKIKYVDTPQQLVSLTHRGRRITLGLRANF